MSEALLAGLLAGYGIAIPVGAVGVYLVALSARTSWHVGACAGLGVATADAVYALVAVAAGSAAARAVAPLADLLELLAAGVLATLAVLLAVSAARSHRRVEPAGVVAALTPLRAYLQLLAMTLVNPMTVVYFAALVLGARAGVAVSAAQQVAFVVGAGVASASWQLLLAVGGAGLGRLLTSPRGRLVTTLTASALMVLLALRLVAS